ncbi:TCB2 [Hepatospora eriocheir]|uniref:TCB2 n=1 Tax=Hepatospora eriocheir TaxID=1081669 RepID=A0A1X0QG10_9MICR|nr:TCB2 [Hepatospora eriocheir]
MSVNLTYLLVMKSNTCVIYQVKNKPENTVAMAKHEDGCLMFLGCISSQDVRRLIEIESTMIAASYKQILVQNLLPSAREMRLDEFIFIQNNNQKHTVRLVEEYFDKNNIDVLEWPPQSPDLNPIESILVYIKCRLAKVGKLKKSNWVIKLKIFGIQYLKF